MSLSRKLFYKIFLHIFLLSLFYPNYTFTQSEIKFPHERPENGNFNRPSQNEILDVTPPGFCWWRAGERGKVFYKVHIYDKSGNEILTSSLLEEPVFIPDKILPAGKYSWKVEATSSDGSITYDIRPLSYFTISDSASELPWIDPNILLKKVPQEHPRLLFPNEQLEKVKKTLTTTRKGAFEALKIVAEKALNKPLMKPPDFTKYDGKGQYAVKRTAYRDQYHEFIDTYLDGAAPMALYYLLTGEKKYGLAAKSHLLNLLNWPLDKETSVFDPRFDEIGLNIAHTAPQIYDWCYDLFTDEEKLAIENMLIERGNRLLKRMIKRDFLNTPGESHDGRVPGYLLEFSIALAHRPEAVKWLDYGLKAILTVFPHWGGSDGGWAEGVDYALSYNSRFITPLHSLYAATGYDLWKKPFFKKFPYFLIYSLSPIGEISPFGDMEHIGIANRAQTLCSILLYHALHFQNPEIKWWVELFKGQYEKEINGQSAIQSMILEDNLKSNPPKNIEQDKFFGSIGWAVMHSDITNPSEDLVLLFKSSPFGQDSHSHADQNSFAIMKGGKALALPSGARYPQQGSPFHTQYTIQTIAHNAILVNGDGQKIKDENAVGELIAYKNLQHIAYAAGDATKCYGKPITKYLRYILFIRPSLIIVMDELESSEPVQIDWLMHGKEKFEINNAKQNFISYRKDAYMNVQLISSTNFNITQDDSWPIDPKEGYPMVTEDPPAKQWHLKAVSTSKSNTFKIAAIMSIGDDNEKPDIKITQEKKYHKITAQFPNEGIVSVRLNLSDNEKNYLADITYELSSGSKEQLVIPLK